MAGIAKRQARHIITAAHPNVSMSIAATPKEQKATTVMTKRGVTAKTPGRNLTAATAATGSDGHATRRAPTSNAGTGRTKKSAPRPTAAAGTVVKWATAHPNRMAAAVMMKAA